METNLLFSLLIIQYMVIIQSKNNVVHFNQKIQTFLKALINLSNSFNYYNAIRSKNVMFLRDLKLWEIGQVF